MTHWRRRQTRRQAFFFRVIGSSSARIEERLTDGDFIVVEVFRELLLGQGLLGVLDNRLRDEVVVGLITSAEVRGLVIHDIKEAEGARQQEQKGDKRDEEIRGWSEWRGRRGHSKCAWNTSMTMVWMKTQTWSWAVQCARIYQGRHSKDNDTKWQQKETTKTKDLQCMMTHALASTTLTERSHVLQVLQVTSNIVGFCSVLRRDSHCGNASFEVLSLHPPSVAADRRQLWTILLQQ